MFERVRPPANPVTLHLDGEAVVAERGEPLAVALLASGEGRIARSPKLHRPRSATCLRGDCDGCIARVDGSPNVMTCLRPARGGEIVVTQNVLGSKDTDLLRITDWFFPKGIDHHHLLAGIPGVSEVMQSFARRMAGIGRLPSEIELPRAAARASCDALIVGGGISGAHVAATIAARGLRVILADEGQTVGGSALAGGAAALEIFGEADLAAVDVHTATTVIGIYDREAVLAGPKGATVVSARATVLATGAHDGVVAVPNNDLPGVMSARALALLYTYGVVPKERVAVVGEGVWATRVREALGERVVVGMGLDELASIRGGSRVKGVTDREGRTTKVSVVAIAAPGAPSFELAESMGAKVELRHGGYAVVTDLAGKSTDATWAVGECAGDPFDPTALAARGQRVAEDIVSRLALSLWELAFDHRFEHPEPSSDEHGGEHRIEEQVVAQLRPSRPADGRSGSRDSGEEAGRHQRQHHAGEHEIAGAGPNRHRPEERPTGSDAGRRSDREEGDLPADLAEVEPEEERRRQDHDRLDCRDESGDADGLAREDGAPRQRRDEQTLKRAILALSLPRTRQREDRCERHRDPDHSGRDVLFHVLLREERERGDDRDEHGEEAGSRQDLPCRKLDEEILLRDEPGLAGPARSPRPDPRRTALARQAYFAALASAAARFVALRYWS
jgi:sarcosine oxidase subunit alpha